MIWVRGNTVKAQLFGIALMILGVTLRANTMIPGFGLIIGIGATWIGLLIVIIATFSKDG